MRDLDRGDVVVEVGGRECAVEFVTNLGTAWQTNSRLPAGLPAGRYDVRLRLKNGRVSDTLPIELRTS